MCFLSFLLIWLHLSYIPPKAEPPAQDVSGSYREKVWLMLGASSSSWRISCEIPGSLRSNSVVPLEGKNKLKIKLKLSIKITFLELTLQSWSSVSQKNGFVTFQLFEMTSFALVF